MMDHVLNEKLSSSFLLKMMSLLFIVFCAIHSDSIHVDAASVMSIDLGNDMIKIALVKPGIPMEIVLNSESKRKTPAVVAFKSDERLFGDAAINAAMRKPQSCFSHFLGLLGKDIEDDVVKRYHSQFPHRVLKPTSRSTVQFEVVLTPSSDPVYYTVEELVAMLLNYSRDLASDYAQEQVTNLVLTVPGYLSQKERLAVVDAVNISGLKLLQLMSDHAAVALHYGVFRQDQLLPSPTAAVHTLFFDMGASSTKVSVIQYKKDKVTHSSASSALSSWSSSATKEKQPHLYVRGYSFDRLLGGSEFDFRLQKHLASEFMKQKGKMVSQPIDQSPKAMSKLLKEAKRVKQVLSANSEHYAQVEGLHEEQDFKVLVKRNEIDELCADLFEKVETIVQEALQMAEVRLEDLEAFVVFGGSWRVPGVQQRLEAMMPEGKEISKSINADEAAALGAVYQAAFVSSGFRVKPFLVKDASLYPIDVSFERPVVASSETEEQSADGSDEGVTVKTVERSIFNRMNIYPMNKAMTFNRMDKDFSFSLKQLTPTPFLTVAVTGIEQSIRKHLSAGEVDPSVNSTSHKGVKAHFHMDESGLVSLLRIESLFEQQKLQATEKPVDGQQNKSTIEKLSQSISDFFKGSSAPEADAEAGKETTDDKDSESESEEAAENEKESSFNGTTTDALGDNAKIDNVSASEEKSSNTSAQTDVEAAKPEMKTVTIEEPLPFHQEPLGETLLMSDEDKKKSKQKLVDLKLRDMEKLASAKALNDLESFIIAQQDKLSSSAYDESDSARMLLKMSSDEERQQLADSLRSTSEWLEEQDISSAKAALFKDKLGELNELFAPLFLRLREASDRIALIADFKDMWNRTETFLNISAKIPEEVQVLTPTEVEKLSKALEESKEYLEQTVKSIEESDPQQQPPILVSEMRLKLIQLERELSYLLRKVRTAPKPKPKPKFNATTEEPKGNEPKEEQDVGEDKDVEIEQGEGNDQAGEEKETTTENPPPEHGSTPRSDL